MPLANPPESFLESMKKDQYRSLVGSKLTLSNWATPNLIRYSELLRKLMPKGLNHAYFTSGRDEIVDKGLRSIRFHRKEADIVVGFSHQWLGNISAAARSLSHDESQKQPFAFFDWPKATHPSVSGHERSLEELNNTLKNYPSEKILAIVVELMGEKSGFLFDEKYLKELGKIRTRMGIPLVFVETTSALYRSGKSLFLTDSLSIKPDAIWYYTGGQLGHIFVNDQYFVEKPLTLISTWDGDDISIARSYHNMLLASSIAFRKNLHFFENEFNKLSIESHGMGCWHSVKLESEKAMQLAIAAAREKGLLFGNGFSNSLMVCPKPDFSQEQMEKILEHLRSCF